MRILVIDDEQEICEMVTKALTRNGYEVITAYNIQDAYRLIRDEAWDLVITDVMIPYVGGFELAEAIKTSSSSTPVIMMTGMSEEVLKATVNKADLVISKPFDSADLVKAVKELTEEKQLK